MRLQLFAALLLLSSLAANASADNLRTTTTVLAPVGGTIEQPDAWYFEHHDDPMGHSWIVSKEPEQNYKTGIRIQILTSLDAYQKQSPQRFVENYLKQKAESTKVLSRDCPTLAEQNLPHRCLETEESLTLGGVNALYRIQYVVHWNAALDLAAVVTLGAPTQDWDGLKPVRDRLLQYKLYDKIKYPDMPPKPVGDQCRAFDAKQAGKLHDYYDKIESGDAYFTIGARGNHQLMLDADSLPVDIEDIAAQINNHPKADQVKLVELLWPYSGIYDAPILHKIEQLTGKKVFGAHGPLFAYPDGTLMITDPKKAVNRVPDAENVIECVLPDGTIGEKAACVQKLGKLNAKDAIFANAQYSLTCAELDNYTRRATFGDSAAAFRLYYFNQLVNVDDKKAALYAAKAALAGNPGAAYITAYLLRQKPDYDKKLYQRFMEIAARGGVEKAQKILNLEK